MTSQEFIIWFRGFVKAAHPYNITPKQWEDVKETLDQVKLKEDSISLLYDSKTTTLTTDKINVK